MVSHRQVLKPLYNLFNPARPLELGNPGYGDCQKEKWWATLLRFCLPYLTDK
jgi:hypothetical protein